MGLLGICHYVFFLTIDKLLWQIAETINRKKPPNSVPLEYLDVMKLSKKYKIEAKGVLKFCEDHGITANKSPVYIMPTTAHISLFKGTNLSGMGLGEDRTILIPFDENSRMKTHGEFDFVVLSKRKNVKLTFIC